MQSTRRLWVTALSAALLGTNLLLPGSSGTVTNAITLNPDVFVEETAEVDSPRDDAPPAAEVPAVESAEETVEPKTTPTPEVEEPLQGQEEPAATDPAAEDPAAQEVLEAESFSIPLALQANAANDCSYANPSSGAYASSLCWLNMDGITTEYIEQPAGVGTNRNIGTTCSRSGIFWQCTTTGSYTSKMGAQYGSWERTATATDMIEINARDRSRAAFNTARDGAMLYKSNAGKWYGQLNGYPVSFPLSEGADALTFSADVHVTLPRGNKRGLAMEAMPLPLMQKSWDNTIDDPLAIGNTRRLNLPYGFYSGVAGKPSMYHIDDNGLQTTTTFGLSNVEVTRPDGSKIYDFSVVVADAETTDTRPNAPSAERITWQHSDGLGFRWLPNNPVGWNSATTNAQRKAAALNVAGVTPAAVCPGTPASSFPANSDKVGQSTVICIGGSAPQALTGAAMLQVSPDPNGSNFTVVQELRANGKQAAAFGLITTSAEINVNVIDRVLDGSGQATASNFTAEVRSNGASGQSDHVQSTGTGTTAMESAAGSGLIRLPVDANSARQFDFKATPSAVDPYLASYEQNWVCSKTSPDSTSVIPWPHNGTLENPRTTPPAAGDPWTQIGPGAHIECTVTYIPPYLTLVKTVDNANVADGMESNTAADFMLTAQNTTPASLISGSGTPEPAVTKRPVSVGSFALTELSPDPGAAGNYPNGYDWSDVACVDARSNTIDTTVERDSKGNVSNASVTVPVRGDVTCTYRNTARSTNSAIAASKSANPESGSMVNAGDIVTYTLTFKNEGSTPASVDHVDHLGDVLDDADFVAGTLNAESPLSAELTNGGTQVSITGTVPAGETRTVTFDVKIKPNSNQTADRDQGDATDAPKGFLLRNYITEQGEEPPTECKSEDPSCTEHPISGSVTWEKVDADGTPLEGSQWRLTGPAGSFSQVYEVDDCTTAGSCTGPDQDARGGFFSIGNLPWGEYLLVETSAPAGYVLDDTEHAFTVGLDDPEHIVIDLGEIENRPQSALIIPLTGGFGSDAFLIAGGGLLAALIVTAFIRARRLKFATAAAALQE